MARARGVLPEAKSDTALFTHIAYRAEGLATADIPALAERLGVAVGDNAIRKAPASSRRLAYLGTPDRTIRKTVEVDVAALDFFAALVRLAVDGPNARGVVGDIPGVIQLLNRAEEPELVLLVVYERRSDQRRLHDRLTEAGRVMSWELIDSIDHTPAIGTWRALAVEAAAREGLLR